MTRFLRLGSFPHTRDVSPAANWGRCFEPRVEPHPVGGCYPFYKPQVGALRTPSPIARFHSGGYLDVPHIPHTTLGVSICSSSYLPNRHGQVTRIFSPRSSTKPAVKFRRCSFFPYIYLIGTTPVKKFGRRPLSLMAFLYT
jgi:hypothetical protein